MINKLLRIISFVLCPILLLACGSNNDSLDKYIDSIKAKPPVAIEPLPAFAPVPLFNYPESINRRDPFKQPDIAKKVDLSAPNPNRKKQPLEMFPLDALKFVGTLKQENLVWGLILQPNGRLTRIKPGDYMGQNYGKVLVIKESGIKLQELVKSQGKWEKQFITLNLNVSKEGA
jgi:type IV pilus assembly protein PilP